MQPANLTQQRELYRSQLLDNILPFWLKHARDDECGGYFTCLSRDGSVYDQDKNNTWTQGRIAWVFARLYNEFERNPAWLDMARLGVEFLRRFGQDETGRVYYALARDGAPLMPAKDVFSDLFVASAFAEYAVAVGDTDLFATAKTMVFRMADLIGRPESSPHRLYLPQTRPMSLSAEHMILLNAVQELRRTDSDPRYEEIASRCIDRIFGLHYREQRQVVYEAVGLDGAPLPGFMGRWITPGHMIELGWFLIHEGQYRNDDGIVAKGADAIRWGMQWGWDDEFGGIVNDVDVDGECQLVESLLYGPYKMWWAGPEALYALLLAYRATGEEHFLSEYAKVRDWYFEHFPDPEYGEWYAFLSPEGHVLGASAKGTDSKGCFHIARGFYYCYRLLGEMSETG